MRNIKFLGLALCGAAIMLASCTTEPIEDKSYEVATFENLQVDSDSIYSFTADTVYSWVSGDFGFTTGVDWDGTYYYNYTVSGQQSAEFVDYTDQYHSACGGAQEGNNFVVAYQDAWSEGASLKIDLHYDPSIIAGTYVCNNAYAVNSIENGDSQAKKFANDDWFLLTFTGYLAGVKTGTVEFYLADFRDGKTEIVKDWTYCDLTALGLVDAIDCALTSSDNGDYGMNTPAYFCLDNFGAEK